MSIASNTRGEVWISAVLYTGIGIVAITLILGAALPLIDALKDKNVVTDTKNLIYVLDKNIREVASEGPGSQRELNPFKVTKGNFYIDYQDSDSLNWSIVTEAFIIENGASVKEGFIDMGSEETNVKGENHVMLGTYYNNIDINLKSSLQNPFLGSYTVIVKNTGVFDEGKLIVDVMVN